MQNQHSSKLDTEKCLILVVDDDPDLRHFLSQELEVEGYICENAAGGAQALTMVRNQRWDLVILDWTLPDLSGVDVCRRMRASQDTTPILMLTAHDDIQERVEALDAGADDYLTKPFSIAELMARVRARLRRKGLEDSDIGLNILKVGDLELSVTSREARRGTVTIKLSVREFELLHYLLKNSGRVCERRKILETVWGETFIGDDNLLDVYIRYLRRKIERPGLPTLIQTVRGVGFMAKEGEIKD